MYRDLRYDILHRHSAERRVDSVAQKPTAMAAAIHYRHRQRATQVVVRLAHLARILGGVVVGGACPHRSGVRSASAATRRNDAPVPCHTCGQLGRNSHQNSHIHRVCGWCHTPPHRLLHLFQKTFVITHINTSFN